MAAGGIAGSVVWRTMFLRRVILSLFLSAVGLPALADSGWSHALTLYGEPKYGTNYTHFAYTNPNAPKGGEIKLADPSSFDTLNPFITKGVKAPGIASLFESLMVQSLDEPQSMYGRIAEKAKVAPDRSSVTFRLRPEARWQDGTTITPDDVVFSLETLKTKGDPVYRIQYAHILKAEKTAPDEVTFTFKDGTVRELPQIAASMPILPKAYYEKHDIEKSTLVAPVGSGPYQVVSVDQGRSITYGRVKDYWGRDLPFAKGQYNFDRIRYDVYRDETVALEAFKAGAYDFRQEFIARNWATAYRSPAIDSGQIVKRDVPHKIPQGMQAFLFNTRETRFADARVREAIGLAMDYEWLNKTIFYQAYTRNRSFFENTEFEAKEPPTGAELALLEPFRDALPPRLFSETFTNPKTDGSGNNRAQLLQAQALLEAAGWIVKDGKRVHAGTGEPLTIEFLLRQQTMIRALGSMRKNLERLGIDARVRLVDDSQYVKRIDGHDFDITSIWINMGLFYPGNEQVSLWQSAQADVVGSNNIGGVKNPVIDAILEKLLSATDEAALIAAGRALDRVLLWNHYVIPNWHSNTFRIAYQNKFGIPAVAPLYDIGLSTWWTKSSPD